MNNGGIQAHRYVIGKIVLFQFSTLQRELQLARNIYDKLNIPMKTAVHQFSPLYIHRQISGRGAFSPRANQSSRLPLIRARFCFMRYIFAWNATRRDVFLSLENRQIEYTRLFRLSSERSHSQRMISIPRWLVISNIRYRLSYSNEFMLWCRFENFVNLINSLKFFSNF